MTVKEIVNRETPAKNDAAPIRAIAPGSIQEWNASGQFPAFADWEPETLQYKDPEYEILLKKKGAIQLHNKKGMFIYATFTSIKVRWLSRNENSLETSQFRIIKVVSFKIENSNNAGLKLGRSDLKRWSSLF